MNLKTISAALAFLAIGCSGSVEKQDNDFTITDGWKIQSSEVIGKTGDILSSGKPCSGTSWYDASVPSTVLGTLTMNGLYADAFTGTNYDKVIDRDDFKSSWWYVNEFEMPALKDGQRIMLDFEGISYSAEVWLNGTKVAARDHMKGPFRIFRYDVTDLIAENNILAVEVFRAEDGDFNIGFVDWNPRPADENMGIFRPVWVRYSDAVSVTNTAVKSKVNTKTLKEAWLTVETTLKNMSDIPVEGVLEYKYEGKTFGYPVVLAAGEEKIVTVDASDSRIFHVRNPRLWWSHDLGNPEMSEMEVAFVTDGKESDSQHVDFGIRQIEDYMTDEGHRGFILNGRKVLIKGAGWTDDIFLRNPDSRNEIELDYVKDMNLNTVRFEEVWGTSQNVYDLCDRKGLLALVGWSCFWEWEVYSRTPNDQFGCIREEDDMDMIAESWRDQIVWLRNHPSIIAWYSGSDMLPRPALEQRYLDILPEIDDRPYVGAAKALTSELSGKTGMKMVGPYDYEAPAYWYSKEAPGGAFGFNTETGIGAQMPMKESIVRMIPADKLWPLGKEYDYHCTTAGEAMHSLDVLKEVVEKRYGSSDNLDDFLLKAHHLDYDGTRAMFEAFRVNRPRSTGLIQWMLNSAWPSVYWQLYDWYLVPTASYWSVKKGCELQQLVYNYGDRHVYAVNDGADDCRYTACAEIYDIDGKLTGEFSSAVEMPSDSPVKLFEVPSCETVSFMFLTLRDKSGKEVASNTYCLSPVEDVHDWANYNWIRIKLLQHADYSALDSLKEAGVAASVKTAGDEVKVTLTNDSDVVAFFVRMALKNADGELVTPVFWDENFVSLKPGETRTYTCRMEGHAAEGLNVEVSGWNVPLVAKAL
ncbi:MAG: glycoside hydrolase family 2 [Bacteroidales bacterium]|nr:glycoside hydrolase family 2 [Bacteroidales bacterium]MBQ9723367.1 glycoside hydrolase family 2 [Bacteroidales bacterium]